MSVTHYQPTSRSLEALLLSTAGSPEDVYANPTGILEAICYYTCLFQQLLKLWYLAARSAAA